MVRLGTNTRGFAGLLVLLAALATMVAACEDNAGATTTRGRADQLGGAQVGQRAIAHDARLAADTTAADQKRKKKWKKVVPRGDCECADGSEFAFWERRADPTRVVLFLDGGGACYDAATCAFTGLGTGGEANYDWSIYGEDPAREGGIFNFARADNPFRDYSFISVSSCTGDAHLGDVTRKYSPKLTVEHNGFVNGTAALSYLAEHYPDAAQVVVVGKSIGSIAAPIYGGVASDLLPDAQVTVFGGQSGHIPDDPPQRRDLREALGRLRQHARLEGQPRARRPRLGRPTVLDPGRPA